MGQMKNIYIAQMNNDKDDPDLQSYEAHVAYHKSISCKIRNKHCEGHNLPCDVCTSYEPIRRRRDN